MNMRFPIPSPDIRIETPRLYLRPYRLEDAAWYADMSIRNRAHLKRFEADNAAMTIGSVEDGQRVIADFAVAWMAGRAFFLGAFLRETDEFAAQLYIGATNARLPEFEVGFFADAQREGQGYVSEAVSRVLPFLFTELGAWRVRLECDDTNARSAAVAERCGFTREGHIRENHLWPDGSITGTLHYGLLRSEYNS